MSYSAYRDDTLLLTTEDKRAAFRAMKDAETPGSRYYMETDGQRDEYYLVHRKDGRISPCKAASAKRSYLDAVHAGKIKKITANLSPENYDLIMQAADNDGMTISTWAAKKLVEIAIKKADAAER